MSHTWTLQINYKRKQESDQDCGSGIILNLHLYNLMQSNKTALHYTNIFKADVI